MAKPLAFVILCGLCSWKNIHGEHGWHRILKYNYALHVQILFILQRLKCISWMSRGFHNTLLQCALCVTYVSPCIMTKASSGYRMWSTLLCATF